MKTNEPGTTARRNELWAKKTALEKQIPLTIDPAAQGRLRADYREICEELETYYFDEPIKGQKDANI